MAQKGGVWRKLMRIRSNQQNCGSTVLCHVTNRLHWEPHRPNYYDRAELHQTDSRICCAPQAIFIWPHNHRWWWRGGQVGICDTEASALETTAWKTNVTRDSRDRAWWRNLVRGIARAADRHYCMMGTRKKKTELKRKQHLYTVTQ